MNNTPSRTFILVSIIVIILLAFHEVPQVSVFGVKLRHINILSDVVPEIGEDTASANGDIVKPIVPEIKKTFKEECPPGVTCFEDYADSDGNGMNCFYEALSSIKKLNRPVRIAYFGDSFIEGDILTCDLREMLQQHFGGSGIGWVDCYTDVVNFRRTINQSSTGFVEFAVNKKGFNSKLQCINQRYFVPSESASMNVRGTKYLTHSSRANGAVIYFSTENELQITTKINGTKKQCFKFNPSNGVQQLNIKDDINSINVNINNVHARTLFYGMSLESTPGVSLDNFSMRGCAGFTLSGIPQSMLGDFSRMRPYDLIILHYGLNVISDGNNTLNYKAYKVKMEKTVNYLKKFYPKTSILIVSIPDRDERYDGTITSMKGVDILSAYQQLIASDTKVAYFDLFNAMGGKGSMRKLVEHKPSLANYDYTHLNFRGGKVLAKLYYDAIIAGKNNYDRRKAFEKK